MRMRIPTLVAALFLVIFQVYPAEAQRKDPDLIVDRSRLVLEEMLRSEDNSLPVDLVQRASGIAIIPGMIKGGFLIGGSYGEGIVVRRLNQDWTGPAFVFSVAGSFGLQIGVQSVDLILVIFGEKAMRHFSGGEVRLGADANIAAGPIGAQAMAATDILLKGGILSYSRATGLFAGVSLEGATIGEVGSLNEAYYGRKVSTREILAGMVSAPESGEDLFRVLDRIKAEGASKDQAPKN